ncbi:MAG: hypothetical protein AAGE18_08960 [Pseudomonadota bacterium]
MSWIGDLGEGFKRLALIDHRLGALEGEVKDLQRTTNDHGTRLTRIETLIDFARDRANLRRLGDE